MIARAELTRVLVAILGMVFVVGCKRTEMLVDSDADLELGTGDETVRLHLKAGKTASFTNPKSSHPLRLRSAGHPDIRADISGGPGGFGECRYYSSTANTFCGSAEKPARREHPLTFLRADNGGAFVLPKEGQGLIVTTDETGIAISVSTPGVASKEIVLVSDQKNERGLPLVIPLPVGEHKLFAKTTNRDEYIKEYRVKPGEYELVHVQIGSKTRPANNGSWNR